MASITVSDIGVTTTPAQNTDHPADSRHHCPSSVSFVYLEYKLLTVKSRPNFASPNSAPIPAKEGEPVISLYQPTSATAFDPRYRHSLLLSTAETSRQPLFHQACIYLPENDELWVTSNLLATTSSSSLPIVLISRVNLNRRSDGSDNDDDVVSVGWQKLRPPQNMTMPAGGTAYEKGMVFCSQGNQVQGTGGLYYMPRGKPPEALVSDFYGREFNSPHDVALTSDGALWFTDPCYGFDKDIRKSPVLPCHVYRYHHGTGNLRVMVDGLVRPTGIAFSPDESTAYITDTDAPRGNGDQDLARAGTIHAFDVILRANSPFLTNRRVFAVPIKGAPVGIKCDERGYVYAGCGDGIEVWNYGGVLQAVIEIPGGVTNFCFGRCDEKCREIFVCAEQKLWRLRSDCYEESFQVDRPGWLEWNEHTSLIDSAYH